MLPSSLPCSARNSCMVLSCGRKSWDTGQPWTLTESTSDRVGPCGSENPCARGLQRRGSCRTGLWEAVGFLPGIFLGCHQALGQEVSRARAAAEPQVEATEMRPSQVTCGWQGNFSWGLKAAGCARWQLAPPFLREVAVQGEAQLGGSDSALVPQCTPTSP